MDVTWNVCSRFYQPRRLHVKHGSVTMIHDQPFWGIGWEFFHLKPCDSPNMGQNQPRPMHENMVLPYDSDLKSVTWRNPRRVSGWWYNLKITQFILQWQCMYNTCACRISPKYIHHIQYTIYQSIYIYIMYTIHHVYTKLASRSKTRESNPLMDQWSLNPKVLQWTECLPLNGVLLCVYHPLVPEIWCVPSPMAT